PELSLSRSSDVLPQIKEYERVSTTVVNAYVGPIVRSYLGHLQQRLTEAGFKGGLFIVLSHGGIAPVDEAARLAAATVLSGPAVTDANVVLGYLDPGAFMGGQRRLDKDAAEAAVERVGTTLKLSRVEAAAGIRRLVNLKMADGIRLMTLRRGVDPRRFALLGF